RMLKNIEKNFERKRTIDMITLYSKPNCPHCVRAKEYLNRHQLTYETVDVTQHPEALEFIKSRGHKTVPQIYVGQNVLVEGGNAGLQLLTVDQVRERQHKLMG
ncbi:MAG: glutaredoxin, partial [Oxalobacteraceae bacterium]